MDGRGIGCAGQPAIHARRDGDRLRWYQVVYWLAYRLGLTVWRRPAPPDDLVALVEGPSSLPAGRALELGCGTGTDTIYLAGHGWDVTGIDTVPKALATARRDASAAGVAPRLIQGDVTRLKDLGVGDGYDPVGGLRLLSHPARRPAARLRRRRLAGCRAGSDAAAVWLSATAQGRTHAAGVTADEVQQRFSPAGWELVNAERTSAETIRMTARRAADQFELWCYQLRRRSVCFEIGQ